MTEENRRRNIELEWERARRDLASAELLAASGLPEGAVSHAYYCTFHCARALLLMDGLEARTHRGVIHLLNRDFARTGRLEPHIPGWLSELQARREDADYDAAAVFTDDMAHEAIRRAGLFRAAAEALLRSHGYL